MSKIDKFKNLFIVKKHEIDVCIPLSCGIEAITELIKKMEKEHSANYTLKFHISND